MSDMTAVNSAIRAAGGHAICAYLTAGYPDLDSFPRILAEVAAVSDVVEIGVPFTDPMADGQTIQQASHRGTCPARLRLAIGACAVPSRYGPPEPARIRCAERRSALMVPVPVP